MSNNNLIQKMGFLSHHNLEALRDSFPICVSFFFIFSAIGALSKAVNIGVMNGAAMSLIIHAAPLQTILLVMLKSKEKGLLMCILISFFVNFRFLVFSLALKCHFKNTKIYKMLLIMFLLNTSVFTVCHAKFKHQEVKNKVSYFLLVAFPAMIISVAATVIGYEFFNPNNALISIIVSMMLPIHFAGIASKSLHNLNIVFATLIGFLLYPIFYAYVGIYTLLLCPAIFSLVLILLHQLREEKNVT